jgi:hypothetical protein
VVENHLFQVVALLAMEPPTYRGFGAVQSAKADVCRAMRPRVPGEAPYERLLGDAMAGDGARFTRGRRGRGRLDGGQSRPRQLPPAAPLQAGAQPQSVGDASGVSRK